MSSHPKDRYDSIDQTIMEDDESAADPTRVQMHEDADNRRGQAAEESDEPAEHTPAQDNAFKWDSPGGVSHRVSPKNYYADDSVFGKFFNVFTMIMLGAGLLLGGMCGYWLRGFFISVEPPATLSLNQESTPLAPPPVDTLPPAVDSAPSANPSDAPMETPPSDLAMETVAPAAAKPAAKTKPAAKKVAVKQQLRSVKLSAPLKNQVLADVNTGGANFKYSARMLSGPQRLVIDLNGLTSTATKNAIAVPAAAKGMLSGVSVEKRDADTLRLSFKIPSKVPPKYSINRTKNGLKVVFRK